MMFQQIQYLGGHKYLAEKRNAKISELFNEAPCDYHAFINYQSSQLINISNIVAGKILF